MSGHKPHPIWLKNPVTETELVDTLHVKASKSMQCGNGKCFASIVGGQTISRPGDAPREPDEIIENAKEFFEDYYIGLGKKDSTEHQDRISRVIEEVKSKGTYEMTYEELTYGSRLAWRNSARCIARMFWNKLEVFDCRHITTTKEMADALIKHVEYGLNGGNIRAAITLFPQRIPGREDFRMWNSQFFTYAGYKQPDGSVIGDPQNVALTKLCEKLGWKGAGTRFDIMPLIVSAPGQPPHLFEIPKYLCMEVPIEHPTLKCIGEMDLRWYAMPAVADMRLDVGGLEFTAAPFNGWYTSPEIGTRNLCDENRYNLMPEVAKRMGLDTSTNSTLWKDKAMVHLNVAVLHSYQKASVSIVDHHSASDAYSKFMVSEHQTRGGCPSDWIWLVPPIGGALTSIYHQDMILYKLRPSYEYQEKAWKNLLNADETKK